ncbi:uncharacterized protein LOC120431931 [Culex pipiens pallens]|uniref:(northern house mosquito) hypothetical protein n=1 Tax=Culex pipiens TaxID=7175 RepID=A0A8D8L5I2_CULPI|nr:uncharacterized protein LOC120431931 [Culex pipiens pallens]
MPRTYKRAENARGYQKYGEAALQKCLKAIQNGMTHRKASEMYGIPRTTITNRLQGKTGEKVGGRRAFTDEEEQLFVDCLVVMRDSGLAVNEHDLRFVVKSYLTEVGKTVPRFADNKPGPDWTKLFLGRHPELAFLETNRKGKGNIPEETLSACVKELIESSDIPGVEIAISDVPEIMQHFLDV